MPDQITQLIDPMTITAKAWIGTTEGIISIIATIIGMGVVLTTGVMYVSNNTAIAESAQKTASQAEVVNDRQDEEIRSIDRRLVRLESAVKGNTKAIDNLTGAIEKQPNILIDRFEELLENRGVIK